MPVSPLLNSGDRINSGCHRVFFRSLFFYHGPTARKCGTRRRFASLLSPGTRSLDLVCRGPLRPSPSPGTPNEIYRRARFVIYGLASYGHLSLHPGDPHTLALVDEPVLVKYSLFRRYLLLPGKRTAQSVRPHPKPVTDA